VFIGGSAVGVQSILEPVNILLLGTSSNQSPRRCPVAQAPAVSLGLWCPGWRELPAMTDFDPNAAKVYMQGVCPCASLACKAFASIILLGFHGTSMI
jgi:hypothetical protein